MNDLISREALIDFIEERSGSFGITVSNKCNFKEITKMVKAVDAVEVVRCRDCIRRDICRTTNTWAVPPNDDWFCADGERKEVSE